MIISFTRNLKTLVSSALVLVITATGGVATTQAQLGNTGTFLQASLDDASLLTTEYIRPYVEGFGAASNTGWMFKAGTHSVLGFDLSVRAGAAIIPSGKNQFDINDLELNSIRPLDSANSITPTVSGRNSSGPQVGIIQTNPITGAEEIINSFAMPSGTGFSYAPVPTVQANLGLPFDTDIMFRFIPTLSISEFGEFGLIGLGLKHELNRWIPAYLPVDISIMAAFMDIGLTGSFTLSPSDMDYDTDPNNLDTPDRWAGQKAVLNSRSWNANLMIGRTLGPVSLYGGAGLQSTLIDIDFDGEYPVYNLVVNEQGTAEIELGSQVNPLSLNIETETGFSTFAGLSFKLGFFYFTGEFTYGEYSVLNAGLGFSFR